MPTFFLSLPYEIQAATQAANRTLRSLPIASQTVSAISAGPSERLLGCFLWWIGTLGVQGQCLARILRITHLFTEINASLIPGPDPDSRLCRVIYPGRSLLVQSAVVDCQRPPRPSRYVLLSPGPRFPALISGPGSGSWFPAPGAGL